MTDKLPFEDSFTDAVEECLDEMVCNYSKENEPQEFSFRDFCGRWVKRSDVYTHLLHRYPAKLLPYIPIFFLNSRTTAFKRGRLLDPFAGTGTVLVESMIQSYRSMTAFGVEINPLVRLIAKVKTTPLNVQTLKEETKRLGGQITRDGKLREVPEFPFKDLWFTESVQRQLATIRYWIEKVQDSDLRDFFWVCFSSTIRKVSLADPSVAPPVKINLSRFRGVHKQRMEALLKKKLNSDAVVEFLLVVKKNTSRMSTFVTRLAKIRYRQASVIWDDARNLKQGKYVEKGVLNKKYARPLSNVDLVITSPPYVNAQRYLRTVRLEMYWLGISAPTELNQLDQKYVGTERVYYEEYTKPPEALGVSEADELLERLYEKDQYRAGILANYLADMKKVISRTVDTLKPGGHLVMVVGNNTMRGLIVENHRILLEICRQQGAEDRCVFLDHIKSRGMITKRHETSGMILSEWIIVMRKT